MVGFERDIQESYIHERAPEILETLLIDRTMTAADPEGRVHRIRWCTDDCGFSAEVEIISWNIWQMDGIKFVVPNTCKDEVVEIPNLDGSVERKVLPCKGCKSGKVDEHNGVRCRVMDWETGKPVLFMPPFDFKPIVG